MKKKILTKHILMALAMAAMVPAGQAWATLVYLDGTKDIDDITTDKVSFLPPSKLIFTSAANSQDGKNWVTISHTGKYNEHLRDPAIAVSGNAGDLREYNFDVTVGALSSTPNSDALRVTGSNAGVQLGDFKADVGAINSDAITIGDETCGSSVTVNNFTADVDYGSGIRVNAYKWDEPNGTTSATVAVIGATKITINGNAWQQDKDHDTADLAGAFALHILGGPVPDWVTLQKGAGVYAGYDEAWGKKNINSAAAELHGDVDITLNAEGGAYGLWAGRNGSITVGKSLTITANQANSDGIAATNTDYNTLAAGGDNTYGSRIELNGGSGSSVNINMNGSENGMENSHAIYANGKNTSVKSGEQGIGHFDITGDIAAENGGLINLHATGNQSWLKGDVKAYGTESGKGAAVNLNVENALAGKGTIAAANGGTVNLKLGAYSNWSGRIDDYQDAGNSAWESHSVNIENAFEGKDISSKGEVNLSLDEGAVWNVTGQSWVTSLDGTDSFISYTNEDGTAGSHALHIGTLKGTNTFVMDIRPDADGDMLYVKDGSQAGTQNLIINNRDEVLSSMAVGEKVRFATVQKAGGGFIEGDIDDASSMPSDGGTFGAKTRISGAGVFNVDFGIEYHTYGEDVERDKAGEDAETANDVYNGGGFSADKPGSDYVENNYGVSDNVSGQSLLAEEDNVSDRDALQGGTQNVYIVRQANTLENVSDAGKTIIAMSKVNYSNAVYMDRLNKRMGEARYIDGDDGLWVRMRHDRIGKEDAFRSMNTMFELGYDWHAKGQKDGEHRQGVAFDYMRGTADYKNVAGDGDVRRAGVWLYDTWLGDKGHYSDYVVKYGRLSNDFDIYSELGEKIKGDYDNDVWSVSAEYGRKKDLGNDWYIEPQVQAQYAYVTSADYTTSQGTKVSLDSIDSLIGRAGFRLGRDTDEANTVYFKADILHEFLGGQSIRAMDSTGTLSTTYENEGTWYDVGFGFSHRMSKDKYMFLDVEKLFGNDNEDTYQVNIGLNMAF